MGIRLRSAAIATVIGGAMVMACSGGNDNPLGGPFGGTAQEFIGPTQGAPPLANSGGTTGSSSGAPSSSSGGTGPSSGAPGGSNGSSGTPDPGGNSNGGNNGNGSNGSSSSSGAPTGSTSSSGGPPSSSGSSGSGNSSGGSSGSSSGHTGSSGSSGSSSSSSGSSSSGGGSGGMMMTPTWTYIYTNDLNQKTCNTIPSCHVQWNSASSAYQYLQQSACLPSMNCIAGFGAPGNMPLIGTLSAQDTTDIKAWVAAGSQNN